MPQLRSYSSILLVQTAFIGDVVLAFPTAQALREAHPTARIGLLTTPAAAPLARCMAAIDEVIVFDKRKSQSGLRGIFAAAQAVSGYECVISAHRSLRTSLVVWLAKLLGATQHTTGFATASAAWLYDAQVEYPAHKQEVERVLALLAAFADSAEIFGSTNADASITFTLPEKDLQAALELVDSIGGEGFIAIAPGSVWATKRWHEAHCQSVAQTLTERGKRVVLLGGEDDKALCERIAATSGAVSLAGKTSLPQMLAVLQRASVLLCNDSAPLHLANLVGCRVVAVFGPTIPAFGFAPRGERDTVLEDEGLACRPCSSHGAHECPLGTHECMRNVTPERVIEALLRDLTD
jgi:heptosyltransferase II